MQGGPSQMDTFDPKPELARLDGQPLPASFKSDDLKLQFMSAAGAALMGSPFAFEKRGQSGWRFPTCFRTSPSRPTTWRWSAPAITSRSSTVRR